MRVVSLQNPILRFIHVICGWQTCLACQLQLFYVGMQQYALAALKNDFVGAARSLLQGNRIQDPAHAAVTFKQKLQQQYGADCPDFLDMSWQEAAAQAHRQYKFLLVYLHSPDHEVACVVGLCLCPRCSIVHNHVGAVHPFLNVQHKVTMLSDYLLVRVCWSLVLLGLRVAH